jgi:hypothetical protein
MNNTKLDDVKIQAVSPELVSAFADVEKTI